MSGASDSSFLVSVTAGCVVAGCVVAGGWLCGGGWLAVWWRAVWWQAVWWRVAGCVVAGCVVAGGYMAVCWRAAREGPSLVVFVVSSFFVLCPKSKNVKLAKFISCIFELF